MLALVSGANSVTTALTHLTTTNISYETMSSTTTTPNENDVMNMAENSQGYPQTQTRHDPLHRVCRTVPSSPTPSRCSSGASLDAVSLCLPHLDHCRRHQVPQIPSSRAYYDMTSKIIMLGDYNVGKTSILRSLSRAKDETGGNCCCEFRPGELVTAIFKRDRKQSLVKVMDTGGQEKYRSMTSSYYRGVHGCLLVFDVTREDTFHNIVLWHQDLENYTGDHFVTAILVGTTSHPGRRVVSAERAFKMAESMDITYLETDTNDDVMTIAIVQRLLDVIISDGIRRSTTSSVIIVPESSNASSSKKKAMTCSC